MYFVISVNINEGHPMTFSEGMFVTLLWYTFPNIHNFVYNAGVKQSLGC